MVQEQSRSEKTRELIINSARKVFLEKGYAETSTRNIADVAGITQPAMYHHFNDKEAVYLEVVNRVGKDVREVIGQGVLKPRLQPLNRIDEITKNLFDIHPKGVGIFIHESYAHLSPAGQRKLGMLYRMYYLDPLTGYFNLPEVKLRKEVLPDEAADILIYSLNAMFSSFYRIGGQSISTRDKGKLSLRLILFGIAEEPDEQ
ncbi:transcriptional regulator [Paucilactobacillus oligofermentans DSM 15707 = LMG 22743]|uniref:Transcriptional regulator n=1 Tax=Paucilactobacillus oligofermentans DSM 15707 = LMG 22743 TaxID=1423778 RepID=A0A0R1RFT0_9LACO|nr:TetR/AcrR family transcriptional regulator [Paucilactobacillus oligofermentans]KRL55225.1 transcriptional regulator [Paucilactobacillus oligofermentans DSM 15707 = LMG 22743]CUS25785.1 Probable TetR family transcriptional regulator [Paucilactobacillus oligofermentans DSM 15707 = LMG 22743]